MRPDSPLAHAKHIVRLALLLVVGLVVLVLGRSFFVPDSWGQYGAYRAANLAEQEAKPVWHGGNESCATCHSDQFEELAGAGHRALACESCHAPLALHVAGDDKVADMPMHRDRDLCLNCHERLESRPSAHPQIHPKLHVEEEGGEFTEDACFDCHEAHEPM